jgi:hypothetical protein
MLARAIACSVHGLAGVPVVVEADIANGLPNLSVGLLCSVGDNRHLRSDQ